MSEDAIQIIARGPRAEAEAAAAAIDADPLLEGATYSILEEDEDRGVWRIDAFPTSPEEAEGLNRALTAFSALSVTREVLADADWLAMALSGLPPVRAGRFFVYGMHDRGRTPASTVNLRIEAGAAFGTGHHGTTVGCLVAYDRLLKAGRFARVLDVGAGTGVLAIAAARTGAHAVVGTDIDPVSVRISRENARVNRTRARFVHASGLGHRLVRGSGPYDLVFANILARPLCLMARDLALNLAPGGTAILAGLLANQARWVLTAHRTQGLRLDRMLPQGPWTTIVVRKTA
jgi:ribosomal protein L11 methyltransferase